jgi:lipoprotein-anchoring transpeptidase ErfK/SrfK
MIVAIFVLVMGAKAANAEVFITIYKSEQTMYVDTPQGSFSWEVSTGRQGYETPAGRFQPTVLKSMHYSSKYDNAPMPNSIFFYNGYAIHATYDIKRLGRPASHGCVRLSPQNAKWLFHIVKEHGMENTFIEIVE